MSTTNILDLNNRIDALEKNSGGGPVDSAKRSDIATEFSATTAYTAGCFVYYEGKLYQFNADHAAGAWDPTDVVEANVTDQIVSNASAIAGLTASDVDYVNTTSGLTATDVQGAVDEIAASYPAAKVMLSDGVTSVEDAVDEVANGNLVASVTGDGTKTLGTLLSELQALVSSSDITNYSYIKYGDYILRNNNNNTYSCIYANSSGNVRIMTCYFVSNSIKITVTALAANTVSITDQTTEVLSSGIELEFYKR